MAAEGEPVIELRYESGLASSKVGGRHARRHENNAIDVRCPSIRCDQHPETIQAQAPIRSGSNERESSVIRVAVV